MADDCHGATITFGTSSWTANLTSIDLDDITREAIETTHLGSTVSKSYIAPDIYEPGGFGMEFEFNPDSLPPYNGAVETITVKFPIPAGKTVAAQFAASGFMDSFSPGALVSGEKMAGSAHVKFVGAITTAASSS